jgi:hypothetical protein
MTEFPHQDRIPLQDRCQESSKLEIRGKIKETGRGNAGATEKIRN